MKRNLVGILILIFVSCSHKYPKDVSAALDKAGDNRGELEKVLTHYAALRDTLKLDAAYFLIKNMESHYSFKGDVVDAYNKLFDDARSRVRNKETYIPWDSLSAIYLETREASPIPAPDLENITADFLIKNIDSAFAVWRRPIARDIDFAEFCEFLLPYRVSDEPLGDWRKVVLARFGKAGDAAQLANDFTSGCDLINDTLMGKFLIGLGSPVNCPYTPRLEDLLLLQTGTCNDAGKLTTEIMRALGVPVATDFTPNWGNAGLGHSWNVVLYQHKTIPFMGTESDPGLTKLGYNRQSGIKRKMPKVYRNTYAAQEARVAFLREQGPDVPDVFLNVNVTDVTRDYMPVADVRVPLGDIPDGVHAVYLCVFDNQGWTAVQSGTIKDHSVVFTDMGRGIVYLPMYYEKGTYLPAANPLLLDKTGGLRYLIPDAERRVSVRVDRKYPEDASNLVEKGDQYELFYWNSGWRSLGQRIADTTFFVYTGVSSNALLLLRDETKGKQERIFTYQDNQQLWW
jgi:hypothetical protein